VNDLTEYDLKLLFDSTLSNYYAVVNYGATISKNHDPLHALQGLHLLENQPNMIWLNHIPFVNTSHFLIESYMGEVKPTIEIMGNFAAFRDPTVMIEELQCLAKLLHLGFVIQHWDSEDFKNHLSEPSCRELIIMARSMDSFHDELNIVEKLLKHVNEISSSSAIMDWCKINGKSIYNARNC